MNSADMQVDAVRPATVSMSKVAKQSLRPFRAIRAPGWEQGLDTTSTPHDANTGAIVVDQ